MRVKLFTLAFVLLFSGFSFAKNDLSEVTFACKGQAYYTPLTLNVKFDFKEAFLGTNTQTQDGKQFVVHTWSITECEDTTELTVKKEEWESFLGGKAKSFDATLHTSEPDVELTMFVSCSR